MMGPVNPMQLVSMIKNGKNPEQLLMSIMQNNMKGNPMMQNIFQLAQHHDYQGIENVARNLAKEKGIDFDKEFRDFRNNLGL